MKIKKVSLENQVKELEKQNKDLQEQCGKLRQQNLRLASLRVLWRKSALRYQKIAAALSHAYYTSHALYSEEYGADITASHEVHLAS